MENVELTGGVLVMRGISWVVWAFIFSSMLIYFQVPFWA